MLFNICLVCYHVPFSASFKPAIPRLLRRDLSAIPLSFSRRYSFSYHNSSISLTCCYLSLFSLLFTSLNLLSVISCDVSRLSLRSSVSLLKAFNLMLLSHISCVNKSKRTLVSVITFLTIFKSFSSFSLRRFMASSIDMIASLVFEVFPSFYLLYF